MKFAELKRVYHPELTEGNLTFNGRSIPTIERPWLNNKNEVSCIPEGEYILYKGHMEKHNVDHYLLKDVKDRTGIFVHKIDMLAKNPQLQLLGCIGASAAGIIAFEKWGNWETIHLKIYS